MLICQNPNCSNPFNSENNKFCTSCGQSNFSNLLRYRYYVKGLLGEGGFGRTYAAADVDRLDAPCVIKQFFPPVQGTSLRTKSAELFIVAIPGGSFMMGSPDNEGYYDEYPQHQVIVAPFFIGKFPITQAQWKAVAALPSINKQLHPDPSGFKGATKPVENILWHDAQEFCARLSLKTKRNYRLPSEAEWEYACRAGSTTPFHFGETITTDLANYNGVYTYAGIHTFEKSAKGKYREHTTPVGSFGIANAFGLYDMHGLVWEWCADPWHDNYLDAPNDGSVWQVGGDSDRWVLRGGSWYDHPAKCRSANRSKNEPGGNWNCGFRVVLDTLL